ncbi:MAG: ABC transporter ATP-binding protein [Chloroflexota bacterium]
MNYSIEFNNIIKRYKLGKTVTSVRDVFRNIGSTGQAEYHYAVNDVSFQLKPGESLGIIGPNGAGKTTTLKLLSGVTKPTSGLINVNGRFSALIELGAGFHPDLTGRENVYLNGTILGMSRAEINERFDDILDFAGIGDFIDTPVKRYSSGMYARLGFSIAAHVDPDVLLVDEVLAVGDFAFRAKCYKRMDDLRAKGTSLIFVTHDMDAVRRVCDRGMVMYSGKSVFEGTSAEAVVAYSDVIRKAAKKASQEAIPSNKSTENGLAQRVMSFAADITNVSMFNSVGDNVTTFEPGDEASIVVTFDVNKDMESPVCAFSIRQPDGTMVYDATTRWLDIDTPSYKAGEQGKVEYKVRLNLVEGVYNVGADLASHDLSCYIDRVEQAMGFAIVNGTGAKGIADLQTAVSFGEKDMETA